MKFFNLFLALSLLVAMIMANPLHEFRPTEDSNRLIPKGPKNDPSKDKFIDELVAKIPRKAINRIIERKVCRRQTDLKKCKEVSQEMTDALIHEYHEFFNRFTDEDKAKICKTLTSDEIRETLEEIAQKIKDDMNTDELIITPVVAKTISNLVQSEIKIYCKLYQ